LFLSPAAKVTPFSSLLRYDLFLKIGLESQVNCFHSVPSLRYLFSPSRRIPGIGRTRAHALCPPPPPPPPDRAPFLIFPFFLLLPSVVGFSFFLGLPLPEKHGPDLLLYTAGSFAALPVSFFEMNSSICTESLPPVY